MWWNFLEHNAIQVSVFSFIQGPIVLVCHFGLMHFGLKLFFLIVLCPLGSCWMKFVSKGLPVQLIFSSVVDQCVGWSSYRYIYIVHRYAGCITLLRVTLFGILKSSCLWSSCWFCCWNTCILITTIHLFIWHLV